MFKLNIKSKDKNNSQPIKGYVDMPIDPYVRGWVASPEDLSEPFMVKITKGLESKVVVADKNRPDVLAAGQSKTPLCGFEAQFSKNNFALATVQVLAPVKALKNTKVDFSNRKLFFMHIPKTAGSSVNEYLLQSSGAKDFLAHIEGIRGEWSTKTDSVRTLSGHIGYSEYQKNFNSQRRVLLSFFRDPYLQLVSHLNWVRHLSEPDKKDFLDNHSILIKKITKRMSEFDLSEIEGLKDYISSMPPAEIKLFDNFQTRFLASPISQARVVHADYERALDHMRHIDIVGIVEDMESSIKMISKAFDFSPIRITPKMNVNPYSYGVDLSKPEIKEILYPLVKYDLDLYRSACDKYNAQKVLLGLE